MNIGAMYKLAKNGLSGADFGEIAETLKSLGIHMEMQPLTVEQAPEAMRAAAVTMGRRGASIARLRGRTKAGDVAEALIVMVPAPAPQKGELTAKRPLAIVSSV